MPKTMRIHASTGLDGDDQLSANQSLAEAIDKLGLECQEQGREALWDTLEVEIDREGFDDVQFGGDPIRCSQIATVRVSALAVKR